MFIFSGSSNPVLAKKIAEKANAIPGEVSIEQFANGEKRIRILSEVRNQEVVIVQSFSQPVDSNIMEFLLIADALERAGSKRVSAIIPWMGYSLQDKVFRDGEPIAARVVADLISHANTKRVFLLDLHNSSIPGFFSVPTTYIRALNLFVEYAKNTFQMKDVVVVSPDFGGIKQSRTFAEQLHVNLAHINKHRDLDSGDVSTLGVAGYPIDGKICLLYDDVINSGGTVVEVAKFLKENGAREVHFFVSHGLFADGGMRKMEEPAIDSVVISDSVHHSQIGDKIKILSVAQLFVDHLLS
ncbi:MAG: ribose-phosphate pyrophosphokinase [Patescibacteria group bacterium]